ncbi:MAG: hypothetical protein MI974_12990 [Chitinophagales bacterium]|nr:hypothetical protein [Chitinophagales bacterium]
MSSLYSSKKKTYQTLKMIEEKTNETIRDVRLWMALASMALLIWLTIRHYPM